MCKILSRLETLLDILFSARSGVSCPEGRGRIFTYPFSYTLETKTQLQVKLQHNMTGADTMDFADLTSLVRAELRRNESAPPSLGMFSTALTQCDSKSIFTDGTAETSKSMPRFTHVSNADIRRVGKGPFILFTNDSRLDTEHGSQHR